MKKKLVLTTLAAAVAAVLAFGSFAIKLKADDDDRDHDFDRDQDHSEFRGFVPGSIVVSGTVYVGTADTVTIGEVLPPGCLNNGPVKTPTPATVNVPVLQADQPPATTAVTVACGFASDNGEAPNLKDSHNVWNNAATDGSFGVSSPIVLFDLSTEGQNFQGTCISVEFSAGCVSYEKGETPDQFLERADRTLYADKRSGKRGIESEPALR